MQCVGVGLSVGALVGATESHTPSVHPMLAQSSPLTHAAPPAQPWQLPPQSTSVSSPFTLPSMQYAGVGAIVGAKVGADESQTPNVQLKLAQSVLTTHELPTSQP